MKIKSDKFQSEYNPYEDKTIAVQEFLKPYELNLDKTGSKIVEFFKGKSVLMTGATGFLGKLLLEKLLRACDGIETIYLLVRAKKGKNFQTRVEEILDDVVFEAVLKINPKCRHKIVGVQGDCSLKNLGLSGADRTLLTERVDVIFHSAATTKFDEKLKIATAINVQGTQEILNLGHDCKHLQALVYVGTAFSNCPRKEIDEKFYEPPIDYEGLLHLCEKKTDKQLEDLLPTLLGEWPNTYTLTKAVAEDAVHKLSNGLPTCVFRPAITIATYKEPLKGWIDNLFGATGYLVGVGVGLIKSAHATRDCNAELVPGDYVINGIIAAAYKTAVDKNLSETPVYNYVASPENPLNWGDLMSMNQKYGVDVPTMKGVWYYSLVMTRYKLVHMINIFFLHLVPAFFIDIFLTISGKKIRMLKVYEKIHKFTQVVAYFANRQWKFHNNNVQNLWAQLKGPDQKIFPFSMKELSWEEHSKTHLLGMRIYKVGDPLSTLPQARKRWFKLWLLHRAVQGFFLLLIFRLLFLFILINYFNSSQVQGNIYM